MCDKYELLISLIQGYPHLYDKSSKHFKDQRMKENSWKQISQELEMTVKDCQRIRLNLGNKFGREKKVLPSGSGAPVTPPWEYSESMSFLNAYIKPRNTYTTTPVVAKMSQPTMTTLHQYAPPLRSPIFIDTSSSCSSSWSNSTMIDSPLDCPTQDMLISPLSNKENEVDDSQEESMYEENIIIQFEQPEEQTPTTNSEKVQPASRGED
ncbi:hypothetical protein JTB14_026971 [Gonioctena quinquepunctata]|nr:hypothetical protein JTB14_026971 [Gonioctena quinquepunctata]